MPLENSTRDAVPKCDFLRATTYPLGTPISTSTIDSDALSELRRTHTVRMKDLAVLLLMVTSALNTWFTVLLSMLYSTTTYTVKIAVVEVDFPCIRGF